MKKILLIAVLTLMPSFANAGLLSDNTYIAANCNVSQSGALASYCNGTTYCNTSSATSLPHYDTTYGVFMYCTVKTLTFDGETSKVLLCFKDQYQCLGVRACNSDYHGTKPTFSEDTIVALGWSSISNPSTGYYVTANIENIAQFSCCYSTSGYTEKSLPSTCSSSANKVAWFKPNSCTSSGTETTTSTGQYLTCKAGYYTGNAAASSGKYTFAATGTASNPCNNISSIGCTACPAGTFGATSGLSTSTCSGKCAIGSYTNTTAQTTCIACQNGKTTSAAGQTSCNANCSSYITYANAWNTATWNSGNTVSSKCSLKNCKAGSRMIQSNSSPGCIPCAAGTYMASSAHTNTACTTCPKHTSNSGTTVSGTTSSTASTAVTQCYLTTNSGATWSDTTGEYDCPTENAPYTN